MTQGARHTIHREHSHLGWNNANKPLLTIKPGEAVTFEIAEASGGQLTPHSTVADVGRLDFGRVNPVTGPVSIDGAKPGDALKVTLLDFAPSGWGWTANIPGFGLLADQFPSAALHIWKYDPVALAPALYGPGGRVPLKPFTGTIGVAPAEPGLHSIVPPRRVGGNMDIRDMALGTELTLPVEVAGALFFDAKGYEVTTGIGPDLMAAARAAVSAMIEELARRFGYAPVDAYMLLSVCGDLRISEIVDVPNWVVSMYFPRIVLE